MRTVQQLLRTPSCVDAPQRRIHPASAAAAWAGDGGGRGGGGGGGSGGRHLLGRLQGGGVKRRRRREGRLQRGPEMGDDAESGDDNTDVDPATVAGAYTGVAGMGAWAVLHMLRYNFMSSTSAIHGSTSLPGSAAHGGVGGGDDSVGIPSETRIWQVGDMGWEEVTDWEELLSGRRSLLPSEARIWQVGDMGWGGCCLGGGGGSTRAAEMLQGEMVLPAVAALEGAALLVELGSDDKLGTSSTCCSLLGVLIVSPCITTSLLHLLQPPWSIDCIPLYYLLPPPPAAASLEY